MKKSLVVSLFALVFWSSASGQTIQLAPPQLRFLNETDLFFYEKTAIRLEFDLAGAEIHFTLDGSEPTIFSPTTQPAQPLFFEKNTRLRAASFHPDFLKSETATWDFLRLDHSLRPDSTSLAEPPSVFYAADGAASLFDAEKGSAANFHDGRWLGFEGKKLEAEIHFRGKKRRASTLKISTLTDEAAWIFPPKSIQFWSKTSENQPFQLIFEQKITAERGQKGAQFFEISLPRFPKSRVWRVVVEPFGAIPEGHSGAGSQAWLFVDELTFER